MASVRIVNASPLILLGKIRRLELLFVGESTVIVPSTTFSEVAPLKVATNLPGWHSGLPPIAIEPDVLIPTEVVRHALDRGESMVLAMALHLRAGGDDVEVVLDERRGRRAAAALELSLVGTAGLVLRARLRACSQAPSWSAMSSTRWNERACTWELNCGPRFWRPLMSNSALRAGRSRHD